MCQVKARVPNHLNPDDIDVICSISGKPIVKSNKYGMFCEDMCELAEMKKYHLLTCKFLSKLTGINVKEIERFDPTDPLGERKKKSRKKK